MPLLSRFLESIFLDAPTTRTISSSGSFSLQQELPLLTSASRPTTNLTAFLQISASPTPTSVSSARRSSSTNTSTTAPPNTSSTAPSAQRQLLPQHQDLPPPKITSFQTLPNVTMSQAMDQLTEHIEYIKEMSHWWDDIREQLQNDQISTVAAAQEGVLHLREAGTDAVAQYEETNTKLHDDMENLVMNDEA